MICLDTSVLVASFAPWHEHHRTAMSMWRDAPVVTASHCLMETYATLTRLPAPFRAPPSVAADWLNQELHGRTIHPSVTTLIELPRRLPAPHVNGGRTYDALIAATALEHGATLVTFDRGAAEVGAALGTHVTC